MRHNTTSITQLTMTASLVTRGAVLALVLAVVAPGLALAQDTPSHRPIAGAAGLEPAQAEEDSPGERQGADRGKSGEGIKVHGHWVLEVHNPDGSLVSRTEFENSLTQNTASPFLASLLARNVSIGFWSIVLASNAGTNPCSVNSPSLGTLVVPCNIVEPHDPLTFPHSFNLAVTGAPTALQLSGSVTAERDADIQVVSTHFVQCGPTANASTSCPNPATGTFTSRLLAQPVPVAAGQIVQVTVTISFS